MAHRYVLRRGTKISKVLGGVAVLDLARKGRLRESDEIRDVTGRSWICLKDVPRLRELGTLRISAPASPGPEHGSAELAQSPGLLIPSVAAANPGAPPSTEQPPSFWGGTNDFFQQKSLPVSLLLVAGFLPFLLPEFGVAPLPQLTWAMAILGLAGVWLVWQNLFQPGARAIKWAVLSALFSMVFGASTLFQFANLAIVLSESQVSWHDVPLWLVSKAGPIYSRALEGDSLKDRPLYDVLASLSLSVGFVEELVKLLPAWLVYYTRSVRDARGWFFVAAASAFGFGVAEGIWYAYATLVPEGRPLSAFLCRFLSGPCGHAALSVLALSIFLSLRPFRCVIGERFAAIRAIGAWAASTMAVGIVHGLYDTLILQGHLAPASLVMAGVLCIGCVGFHRAVQHDQKGRSTLTSAKATQLSPASSSHNPTPRTDPGPCPR